jgi:hypothetical protein
MSEEVKVSVEGVERVVLVCMGIDTREVISGSARGACADCRTEVWVSPTGQSLMRRKPEMVPLCPRCGQKMMEAEGSNAKVMAPTNDQIEEGLLYTLAHPEDHNAKTAWLRMIAMRGLDADQLREVLLDRMREQSQKQRK